MDIDGGKGAQIGIVAEKIVTQGWSESLIMMYKQAIHYICFFMFILCYWLDQKAGITFTGYFNF